MTDVCYRVSIKSYMNTIIGRFNGTKSFDVISAKKMWKYLSSVAQAYMNEPEKESFEQIVMGYQEVL